MLRTLTLKNFRKHTDAEFNFSDGLVVVRGANESGKSTLSEAVMYALFGSAMLRESLEMVVTYEKPESSLKVDLRWHLDGVDYRVVRGKSGAELTYADQLVTGQRETKLFVERLFGCTADTAKLLMFADQNSIRGVLEQGGTAANGLVEKLARLGLIEDLVDRIQAQLPSGNTKAVDAQIETLKAATVTIPEEPSDSTVVAAKAEISAILEKIDLIESLRPHDQEVSKGRVAIEVKNAAQARISKIMPLLAGTVTPPKYSRAELDALRAAQANSAEMARRRKAFATVFPVSELAWDGSPESYVEAIAKTSASISELEVKSAKLAMDINTATVLKINEKACAFCKKDLTDVPEVAAINTAADAKIAKLKADLAGVQQELRTLKADAAAYKALDEISSKIRTLAGDYWSLSNTIPPVPTWIGEAPGPEVPQVDIAFYEKALQSFQVETAKREALEVELAELEVVTFEDLSEQLTLIKEYEKAEADIAAAQVELQRASRRLDAAVFQYDSDVKTRELLIKQAELQASQLTTAIATRDAMHKHNELIKKLRGARPEIAAKMWGTVLGAVSRYFTQIRGEHSVVTRDADGFKVNGRSTEGLSGSTRDALGLAIRMALSKLFLPAVPLLVLDEGFAGADDNRELAGVSTLAGAGFSQVLLVTHSSLPETVADKLITL